MSKAASLKEQTLCWVCESLIAPTEVFCSACNKIQPLQDVNEFQRLNLEPAFNLEESLLEKAYLTLQKKLHPDRFIRASKQEKNFSLMHSSAVNAAYGLLKDPLKRAEHLLTIHGYSALKLSQEEEADLLAHILQIRETLEEAEALICVTQITNQVRHLYQDYMADLEQSFAYQDFKQAFTSLQRLKFISKIMEECSLKLTQLM